MSNINSRLIINDRRFKKWEKLLLKLNKKVM